jgi:hypothetical protein
MVFYPNRIVTPKIFELMNSGRILGASSKYMTVGEVGISKTMSYILGTHLFSYSAKMRYLFKS